MIVVNRSSEIISPKSLSLSRSLKTSERNASGSISNFTTLLFKPLQQCPPMLARSILILVFYRKQSLSIIFWLTISWFKFQQ